MERAPTDVPAVDRGFRKSSKNIEDTTSNFPIAVGMLPFVLLIGGLAGNPFATLDNEGTVIPLAMGAVGLVFGLLYLPIRYLSLRLQTAFVIPRSTLYMLCVYLAVAVGFSLFGVAAGAATVLITSYPVVLRSDDRHAWTFNAVIVTAITIITFPFILGILLTPHAYASWKSVSWAKNTSHAPMRAQDLWRAWLLYLVVGALAVAAATAFKAIWLSHW